MSLIVGIIFRGNDMVHYYDPSGIKMEAGDKVICHVDKGKEIGEVVVHPIDISESDITTPLNKIIRKATYYDLSVYDLNRKKEEKGFKKFGQLARKYKLKMKLVNVHVMFDKSKMIFYFTSEKRVDFREMVKELATYFKIRIELRQIGVRDEAKMVGGLGPCGMNLCCKSFLTDFESISIKMAKDQNLPLNPFKISDFYDGGHVSDVVTVGELVYLVSIENGLEIINCSDIRHPNKIGEYNDGGSPNGVFVKGDLAYIAEYHAGLEIVNVSDPFNPSEIGGCFNAEGAYSVKVIENIAYLCYTSKGLEILNVSNPTLPISLGSFNNGGNVFFAFIQDDLAFLSDDNDGLEIVNISDPTNPWRVCGFNNGGHTRNLFIDNNTVFLTDLDDGLEILQLSNVKPTQNPSFIIPVIITFSILGVILIISVIYRLSFKRKAVQ